MKFQIGDEVRILLTKCSRFCPHLFHVHSDKICFGKIGKVVEIDYTCAPLIYAVKFNNMKNHHEPCHFTAEELERVWSMS